MLATVLIATFFFVACIAMGYFGIQEREQERAREKDAVLASAKPVRQGSCPLCDAPLRRAATVDEIVFEVEHRIDAELTDIAHLLRSPPEGFGRIYSA